MTLSVLIQKDGLRQVATAISATNATEESKNTGTVAPVAAIADARSEHVEASNGVVKEGQFVLTERMVREMERIAPQFIDEYGRALAKLERFEHFPDVNPKTGKLTGYICWRDPRHHSLWLKHRARLLAETVNFVETVKAARLSVWITASKILGVDLPRRPDDPARPGDSDYDPNRL